MGEPIEKKIGQMLLVGFRGLKVQKKHWFIQDINKYAIGSTVLFDFDVNAHEPLRNIENPMQVEELVKSLHEFSSGDLLVTIDHEGGEVVRIKEKFGFSPTISPQVLGEKNDITLTYKHASAMAKELSILGIDLNLAPVVDLNTNPENPVIGLLRRSYSDVPDIVTNHALSFIKAHHKQGILCCLKHFPGHGSSLGDSHYGMVDVSKTWSEIELLPFKNIIKSNEADAIMTAHVFNSNLDSQFPATLSKPVIDGILREKLGFEGVVIADDMQMGAVINHFGFRTAIQKAIEAGVDIITIGNNLKYDENIGRRTVKWIKKLVKNGIVTEARIDESLQRINKLKEKLKQLKQKKDSQANS